MKEGYIPKDKRKKILLLSDDIRTMSGVGNQAKEIIKEVPVEVEKEVIKYKKDPRLDNPIIKEAIKHAKRAGEL